MNKININSIELNNIELNNIELNNLSNGDEIQLNINDMHYESKPLINDIILSPKSSNKSIKLLSNNSDIIESDEDIYSLILYIFNVDINNKSINIKFIFLTFNVFILYFLYGVVQELIFKDKEFKYGLYVTFLQFLFYQIISGILLVRIPKELRQERKVPLLDYFFIGFLSLSTMALSNISCQYLNYPTQVMFKSCKLIPVMIVGVLFLNKKYSWLDYIAMINLTMGMIIFSVGDSILSTKFPVTGLILISLALLADALIGNVQEACMRKYSSSTAEMIFYSKGMGSIILFFALIVTNELIDAFVYCYQNPIYYFYILIFSLVGCFGELFVMTLVKEFGALLAVTVTSCRKVVTIMGSFLLFPKPFTLIYLFGAMQVFFGIGLEIYLKNTVAILEFIEKFRSNRF